MATAWGQLRFLFCPVPMSSALRWPFYLCVGLLLGPLILERAIRWQFLGFGRTVSGCQGHFFRKCALLALTACITDLLGSLSTWLRLVSGANSGGLRGLPLAAPLTVGRGLGKRHDAVAGRFSGGHGMVSRVMFTLMQY